MTSRAFARPEIMSPAGHWPQMRAAIEAGADSVYFGLKRFTARAKVGFEPVELADAMRTLHTRGVKGYLTLNTLVYDAELEEAAEVIALAADSSVDAIIVQDVAAARLARRIAPDLDVHASTQMSVTSAEGVRLAQRFGVRRVVLARELSLEEIRAIRAATDCELEIFVHGALCVSYSGQCFSSEAWGGRSANRGQCAQACRLPYELFVDGAARPLGDARYLLSPGDLSALSLVPEIVQLGLSSLKIEGRYKDAEYVALATRAYREAVDAAWAALSGAGGEAASPQTSPSPPDRSLELEQIYSRGLGPYFLSGVNHQNVVRGRAPRHRGVLLGRVAHVGADFVALAPAPGLSGAPVKPGDGVVFDAADRRSPEDCEEGGRIFEVAPAAKSRGELVLRFGNGAVDFRRIAPEDLVWRTHDPAVERAARALIEANAPLRRRRVDVDVFAREGAPLETQWRLADAFARRTGDAQAGFVHLRSPEPLGSAARRPLDETFLREQFGRLGETPFVLGDVTLSIQGRPFAPASLLNRLRREASEALLALALAPPAAPRALEPRAAARLERAAFARASVAPSSAELAVSPSSAGAPYAARLHLLVRTPDQLDAALDFAPTSLTLDYLDLEGVRPAIERVRARNVTPRIASPRVLKPSEERLVRFLVKLECSILVRSGGLLEALQREERRELVGDFSLNAANAIAAAALLDLGLERITPTHDLNAAQIAELARVVGASRLEVVAFHHLPVFHTEHCVFCRFLSSGTSYKDCGRPCETHRVELRDPSGRAHPVLADVGCRNTVFGAEAQEATRHLRAWRAAGLADFRLEFAHETGLQVEAVASAFRDALHPASTADFRGLGRTLRRLAPQGTTEGSLFVPEAFPMLRGEEES